MEGTEAAKRDTSPYEVADVELASALERQAVVIDRLREKLANVTRPADVVIEDIRVEGGEDRVPRPERSPIVSRVEWCTAQVEKATSALSRIASSIDV